MGREADGHDRDENHKHVDVVPEVFEVSFPLPTAFKKLE